MKGVNLDHLTLWVEKYYSEQMKECTIDGKTAKFYRSIRGYYKIGSEIDLIMCDSFLPTDYVLWHKMLSTLKYSSEPVKSGGCFFRYKDYKEYCGETAFYKSRNKFIDLGLFLETPFKGYYIINPKYVIKIYIKKLNNKEKI